MGKGEKYLGLGQIDANEPVLTTEVKLLLRKDRPCPAGIMERGNLPPRNLLLLLGIGFENPKKPGLP
jgi:hypothetical protein